VQLTGSEGPLQPEPDDAYLVKRAQEGYLDAFEMLVQRHSAAAYRVALRLLGNHSDAQDITQDAFVAAWQGLPRFRHESAFSTWLYRIVTRRALNRLTRGRASLGADLLESIAARDADPAHRSERNDTIDAVGAAVLALPVAQRVAIVLHHFEGLSYADVATVTGSTVPAVRSHLHRARRRLATELAGWR
jgi:RNA polymerase sigma-70 factor, ECF subfamily